MFHRLLESRGTRRPRTAAGPGGVTVSVLLHAVLIGGAVAATGRAATARRELPPSPLIFVAPPPPVQRARSPEPPDSRGGRGPSSSAPVQRAGPRTATLPALPIVPTGPALSTVNARTPDAAATEFTRGGLRGAEASAAGGLGSGDGPWNAATVERAAAPRPGNPAPRYPDVLRAAGTKGQVSVRFVVDTVGRVEAGTVRVLRADDPAFADAVRAVLPSLRFVPAEAGGRRVRQLVEAPFTFTIRP